jgi:hypothetical protein
LRNPKTGRLLEYDGYNEELRLAFEYQGEQHYNSINYWGGEKHLMYVKFRDEIKRQLSKIVGVKLIEVSFFEIKDLSTLENRIKKELSEEGII